jgi:hypothetical protein
MRVPLVTPRGITCQMFVPGVCATYTCQVFETDRRSSALISHALQHEREEVCYMCSPKSWHSTYYGHSGGVHSSSLAQLTRVHQVVAAFSVIRALSELCICEPPVIAGHATLDRLPPIDCAQSHRTQCKCVPLLLP